jgi:hypothetical protein
MTGPDPLHYGWWLASRSAGIVSILAVSVSVIIGLMMANGLPKKGWAGLTKKKLVAVHESTALAGMVAISVHGLTLLGDKFMHPTLSQIAVPFTMGYRPGFTGLGIIAGWLAVFLGQVWLQAILVVTGIPIVYLFLLRVLSPKSGRPASRVPSRSPAERLAASERRAISQRLHPHPHPQAEEPLVPAPVRRTRTEVYR